MSRTTTSPSSGADAEQLSAFPSLEDRPVLVLTGGREFKPKEEDVRVLKAVLHLFKPKLVIHGGARGLDRWGGKLAKDEGFQVKVMLPDYDAHGKQAPPIRNREMAAEAWRRGGGIVVAFNGGSGTQNMVEAGTAHGLRLLDLRDWRQERAQGVLTI